MDGRERASLSLGDWASFQCKKPSVVGGFRRLSPPLIVRHQLFKGLYGKATVALAIRGENSIAFEKELFGSISIAETRIG